MSRIIAYVLSAAGPCAGRRCLAAVGSAGWALCRAPAPVPWCAVCACGDSGAGPGCGFPVQPNRQEQPGPAQAERISRPLLLSSFSAFLWFLSFPGRAGRGSELGGGGPARARGWTGWTPGSLPAQTSLCFCSFPLSFVRLVKAVHHWGCFAVTLHSISSTYSYDFFSKQLISRS